MFDYGEFCPISMATSILCERWTVQIVREMILGATRYSEFQRHMPRISPTLLKNRLRSLEAEGVIIRKRIPGQRGFEYHLTPAGKALEPVLSELGKWGFKWAYEAMTEEQLNASTLMRDFAAALDISSLPSGDTIIQFNVTGLDEAPRHFIQVQNSVAQTCDQNMGHEVDVYLTGTLMTLTKIWYGELSLAAAKNGQLLTVVGAPVYTNALSSWLRISTYAEISHSYRKTDRE